MRVDAPIDSLLKAIGDNLVRKSKQAGLKKKDLAELADVNQNTITAIASGGDLKVSTLIRISRVVGDIGWLQMLIEEPGLTPMQLLESSPGRKAIIKPQERPKARRLGRQFKE